MLRTGRNFGERAPGFSNKEPSMTVQSQKNDADINVIVKRFGVTKRLPVVNRVPLVGDYDEVFDFKSAMNVIRRAQETFNALPSDVRFRFHNDPQLFEAFCTEVDADGKLVNLVEMRKLGLANPEKPPVPEPPPMRVEVVNQPKV